MIQWKVAIVTGSTSGIGLAVARRLAHAGAGIVLNGFGDAGEIEKLRASLADEFKVPVRYKPEQIGQIVADAERDLGRSTSSSTTPSSSTSRPSRRQGRRVDGEGAG